MLRFAFVALVLLAVLSVAGLWYAAESDEPVTRTVEKVLPYDALDR